MIDKIYKYRPLSDFLFKELFYNEIYFASYPELNDPMDLTVKLNFKPVDSERLDYLIYTLIKVSIFPSYEENKIGVTVSPTSSLIKFAKDKVMRSELCNKLYRKIDTTEVFVSYDSVIEYLKPLAKEYDLNFRYEAHKKETERRIKRFFENSFSTSFSESYSDFLMWSHYASKHQGICLEFTLENKGTFPYIQFAPRAKDEKKYKERYSEWESKIGIFWDKIHKIKYLPELPTINFYDFAPVFENEGDCDLMGLSKSKWHGYAYELENIFTHKTLDWKYEKEWRAIEINFQDNKHPESRIRHYPNEALSRVYFGIRTPDEIKERIYQIISKQNSETDFYVAKLTDKRALEFEEWFSLTED